VDDTLRMLADMGRFNVVLVSEVGSRKVSIDLKDVSLEGAFRAVLASAQLEARLLADDIVEVRGAGAR
jgi:type II secretory pathway component HofQ